MESRSKLLFFAVIAIFAAFNVFAQTDNKGINTLDSYPGKIAESIYSKTHDCPNNTQLSIAIIRNGETNYYGVIKENDSIKAIENHDKVFEIGSITKLLTSTVLASLVEDKRIKLSDCINTYYPFAFKDGINITFVSLANHTSGLPRLPENLDLSQEANPYKNYKKKELEEYLVNILNFENEPSKTYLYSNLGTGLLGYTLGLSEEMSFTKLLQTRILDKYGMSNTFTCSQNLNNTLINGMNAHGEIVPNWDFDVLFAAGGIISSAEDLAKYAKAHFDQNNRELALTRIPTFVVNNTFKIGLGWHILKFENGQDIFWHNGGTGGYSSSMSVNIEDKTAVIILSNVSGINEKIDALCFELMN